MVFSYCRAIKLIFARIFIGNICLVTYLVLQAWILRSFRMLSKEESSERFDDNNVNDDEFVTWEEYKENEFEGLDEGDEEETLDSSKFEDLAIKFEDLYLEGARVRRFSKIERKNTSLLPKN